jgi:hypothetical protein
VNTVEIGGENLRVNVKERKGASTLLLPTMNIRLEHVLGAEAAPEIQRKFWKTWISIGAAARAAERGVRFYNPRHGNRQKAIAIHLKDDGVCERLVVEVEDPEAVAAMVNQAVEAMSGSSQRESNAA